LANLGGGSRAGCAGLTLTVAPPRKSNFTQRRRERGEDHSFLFFSAKQVRKKLAEKARLFFGAQPNAYE
jgi:hypothetical protein